MRTALLSIDMQMGMADRIAAGRQQANPQAEAHVAALLALFRGQGWPVVHVFHDEPGTPFARDLPGGQPMPCALPVAGEAVLWKSRSSAFAGTGLEALLRQMGVERVVVVGAVAAFCVTSTVRSASDLGFAVLLPGDALLAFDLAALDGGRLDARDILRMTLAVLGADFARVLRADEVAAVIAA